MHRLDIGGRSGDDDHPDRGCRGEPAHGVHEQRLAVEQTQRLRATRTEPETGTSSRNDDRDVTASIKLRGHVAVVVFHVL
ncbi:hypothetical protein Apa02nite_069150 [Actinoplanes palleronii]|uniref:Uncharacterized protein n=1 Tax=Actinoplanes palleronii TaxID=113570 RepID=A0ABQ4BJE6_9ACTN|nr:hypothetical protein Apa02nite_069150 [Actinoplanes palleronii]